MPDERAATGLAGRRILVTRPRAHADRLVALLAARGAIPRVAPAIAIAPPESWAALDHALDAIERYDWLVATSVNAVEGFLSRVAERGIVRERLTGLCTAAVGPATASALSRAGFRSPFVAAGRSAAALATALPAVAGRQVLFPRGNLARDELPAILRRRGAKVDEAVVYRTMPGEGLEVLAREVAARRVDAIVFGSPSAVRAVLAALAVAGASLATRSPRPACLCLGPVTAEALLEGGVVPDVVGASEPEPFVDLVANWYRHHVVAH